MSSVDFDPKGLGPALTLIYKTDIYNPKNYNPIEILALANLLQANFLNLTGIKAKGKNEFCNFVKGEIQSESPITMTKIISTRFFQNMQKTEPSPLYHEKVLGYILPQVLKSFQKTDPQVNLDRENTQEVKEWAARFLESYMTEEQIEKQYKVLTDPNAEKIMLERGRIGKMLYIWIANANFTENDLNVLIKLCQTGLQRLQKIDRYNLALELISKYCILCAPTLHDLLKDRDGDARTEWIYLIVPQFSENEVNTLTDLGLTLFLFLEKADHKVAVLNFVGNYLNLFSLSEDPKNLGDDILGLLSTAFRSKMFPPSNT